MVVDEEIEGKVHQQDGHGVVEQAQHKDRVDPTEWVRGKRIFS